MKSSTATGSIERVIRSLFQAAIASPAAFAALLAASPLSATQDAKVIGIVGAIYVFVSAVHNALESSGTIPAMLRYVPPVTPAAPAAPTIGSVQVSGDLHLGSGGAAAGVSSLGVVSGGAGGGGGGANPQMVNTEPPPPIPT
jgi:hypothetical protein